jgi:large subunit ribosomal protein L9
MVTKRRGQVRKGEHGGMQLVLTEDVTDLGKQGDVVEVKPGYGRNYLLPRGLATVPTDHNLKLVARYKQRVAQAREARIADLKVLAEQIKNTPLTIDANANEEGHLYGSVGPAEIAQALKAKNIHADAEHVKMDAPIKELGVFEVKLNLGHDIESTVRVLVRPPEKK